MKIIASTLASTFRHLHTVTVLRFSSTIRHVAEHGVGKHDGAASVACVNSRMGYKSFKLQRNSPAEERRIGPVENEANFSRLRKGLSRHVAVSS